MKYFTPELWAALQDINTADESDRIWVKNLYEYKSSLKKLEYRFDKKSWVFINSVSLHDGEVARIEIENSNIVSAIHQKKYRPKRRNREPISVSIEVFTDRYSNVLKYSKVHSIKFDLKVEGDLFPGYIKDFGDWGYDEYSEVNEKALAHNILFSSGSELYIEFEDFRFIRKRVIRKVE